MKRKFCRVVLAAMLLLSLAGCSRQPAANIARIYVTHAWDGFVGKEFVIDLTDRAYWSYYNYNMDPADARDPNAPDEGFTFVSRLAPDDIDRFLQAADKNGFPKWVKDGRDYDRKATSGRREWELRIVYTDGTEAKATGCNMWPDSWTDMNEAFKALTGDGILEPGRIR